MLSFRIQVDSCCPGLIYMGLLHFPVPTEAVMRLVPNRKTHIYKSHKRPAAQISVGGEQWIYQHPCKHELHGQTDHDPSEIIGII